MRRMTVLSFCLLMALSTNAWADSASPGSPPRLTAPSASREATIEATSSELTASPSGEVPSASRAGTPPTDTGTLGRSTVAGGQDSAGVTSVDPSAPAVAEAEAAIAEGEALLAAPQPASTEDIRRTIARLELARAQLVATCPRACRQLIERIDRTLTDLRNRLTAAAHIEYVALGDSYAAGEGNAPYLTHEAFSDVFFGRGGVEKTDFCHRSALSSYPMILQNLLRPDLVVDSFTTFACTGATSLNVLEEEQSPNGRATPLVPPQASALNDQVDLVTLTIGINDMGVIFQGEKRNPTDPDPGASEVIANCLLFNCADERFTSVFGLEETTDVGVFIQRVSPPGKSTDLITPRLQAMFAEIQRRMGSQTRVYVMGYPHFFAESAAGTNAPCADAGVRLHGSFTYTERRGVRGRPDVLTRRTGVLDIRPQLTGAERRTINRALDALNNVIESSMPQNGAFTLVRPTLRDEELLCGSSKTRAIHPLSLITIPLPTVDVGTFNAPGTFPPSACSFNNVFREAFGLLSGVSLNCQQLAYLQASVSSIQGAFSSVNPAPLHPTRRGQEGLSTHLAHVINSTYRPAPGPRLAPPVLNAIVPECPDTFVVQWTDRSVGESAFKIRDTIFEDVVTVPVNPGRDPRDLSYRYDAGGLAGSHHVFSVTAAGAPRESANSNRLLASKNCFG